jgi:hypothetical protein
MFKGFEALSRPVPTQHLGCHQDKECKSASLNIVLIKDEKEISQAVACLTMSGLHSFGEMRAYSQSQVLTHLGGVA